MMLGLLSACAPTTIEDARIFLRGEPDSESSKLEIMVAGPECESIDGVADKLVVAESDSKIVLTLKVEVPETAIDEVCAISFANHRVDLEHSIGTRSIVQGTDDGEQAVRRME